MVPLDKLKTAGQKPCGRFITTYSCDYKPSSERHAEVVQAKAKSPATSFHLLQTKCEAWPIFNKYFYKTTNSTYGSQPLSCYLSHPSPSPIGILAPSNSEGLVQEVRVARETGPVLGETERGQLSCVCGGKGNVLEQPATKDEPQQKIDVHYERGIIVFSSHVDPVSCEDFLGSLCKEAMLQHLLHLPVASGPIITYNDGENGVNSGYMRGWTLASNLKNSASLQPGSWQCTCCAPDTERQNSYCFEMHTFTPHIPRGSNLPLAGARPTSYCTELSKRPWLTEYQHSFTAERAQPMIRLSDSHPHHPRCHWNPHSSL